MTLNQNHLSNNQSALHVVTVNEDISSRLNPDESLNLPKNAVHYTSEIKKEVPTKRLVTCPKDSLVLLQYPWKHELNVKLDRIQPTEIDILSKKVGDYHVFNTSKEVTPIISEVKGYGLCKRPIKVEPPMDDLNEDNMDQLIDQAQALIDTAKKFVTKPVGCKQPRKQPTSKATKSEDEPKALDVLHSMTVNKLATL